LRGHSLSSKTYVPSRESWPATLHRARFNRTKSSKSSSGLIKTHLVPLQRENSEYCWLLRVSTRVAGRFTKRPSTF
jgi:hypothetical protein